MPGREGLPGKPESREGPVIHSLSRERLCGTGWVRLCWFGIGSEVFLTWEPAIEGLCREVTESKLNVCHFVSVSCRMRR